MSGHTTLEAAAQDRKARLAQLKSLKRKAPGTPSNSTTNDADALSLPSDKPDVTRTYLSGRNYDPETRGPKLGFEASPSANQPTLETQAAALALQTKKEADEEEKHGDGELDLFKLRPKKANWDLKRELAQRTAVLGIRTENAIARLVRERVEGETRKGEDLVEATKALDMDDGMREVDEDMDEDEV
jgi:coiled-coil domain-containing protein 12